MVIMMVGVLSLKFILPEVSKNIYYQRVFSGKWLSVEGVLSENGCQEPPHTWGTSYIFLRFLIVIIMVGIIPIELDFS